MKKQWVISNENRGTGSTLDTDVRVWQVKLSNPESREPSVWEIHVLACNVHDAAKVAEELTRDTDPCIITSIEMVGAYGVYAAPNIQLIPDENFKEWRQQQQEENQ